MTRLNKPTDTIRPSVPDPVDAWLDVLVAMLSIPKTDRQTVRDELEDHLRSRIDDLLIHGLTEPQALQKAVAELGETADLARQLSHAHKSPRTRRLAMHALIVALAGTVVALSVPAFRPSVPLPVVAATPAAETVQPAANPGESIIVRHSAGVELTLEQLFAPYAESAGLALEIDYARLGDMLITRDARVTLPADYPASLARLLADLPYLTTGHEVDPQAGDSGRLGTAVVEGRLLVSTAEGIDRRTTLRVVYDLGGLATPIGVSPGRAALATREAEFQNAAMTIMHAIQQHVRPHTWADNGGDVASLSLVGSNLIVTAPQSMQTDITSLLDELRRNRHGQIMSSKRLIEQSVADMQQEIADLGDEYDSMRRTWMGLAEEVALRTVRLDTLPPDASSGDIASLRSAVEIIEFERAEVVKTMDQIRSRIERARLRLEDLTLSAASLVE
jgi:hypothetical protein